MLTHRPAAARRGFSLVELVVAMLVGGVVLGLLTLTGLRQQRLLGDLFQDAALTGQLREASALLPADLRGLAIAAGDIREALDTAVEARGTIATAVVCDTTHASLVLAAATPDAAAFTSYATSIQPGDTAWLYAPGYPAERWLPRAITSVSTAGAGQCGARGPTLTADVAARVRTAIVLDSAPSALAIGQPLRVTRLMRLSLYRSSDGSWNLGERDWNPATQRFNSIQPVAGPFLSASSGGLVFEYLDSNRVSLPTPLADLRAASAIAVTLRGETRGTVRALGPRWQTGKRQDSARVIILFRNRR